MRKKTRWQIATATYSYKVAARTARRREQRDAKDLILNETAGPDALSRLGVTG